MRVFYLSVDRLVIIFLSLVLAQDVYSQEEKIEKRNWFVEYNLNSVNNRTTVNIDDFENFTNLFDTISGSTQYEKTYEGSNRNSVLIGTNFQINQRNFFNNLQISGGFSYFNNSYQCYKYGFPDTAIVDTLTSSKTGEMIFIKKTTHQYLYAKYNSQRFGISMNIGTKIFPDANNFNILLNLYNTFFIGTNAKVDFEYRKYTTRDNYSPFTQNYPQEEDIEYWDNRKLKNDYHFSTSISIQPSYRFSKARKFEIFSGLGLGIDFINSPEIKRYNSFSKSILVGLRFHI